jgi:hypothetical protein
VIGPRRRQLVEILAGQPQLGAQVLLLADRLLQALLQLAGLLVAGHAALLLVAQALLQLGHGGGVLLDADLDDRELAAQVGGDAGVLLERAPQLADRTAGLGELALASTSELGRGSLERLGLVALGPEIADLRLQRRQLRRALIALDHRLELAQPLLAGLVDALQFGVGHLELAQLVAEALELLHALLLDPAAALDLLAQAIHIGDEADVLEVLALRVLLGLPQLRLEALDVARAARQLLAQAVAIEGRVGGGPRRLLDDDDRPRLLELGGQRGHLVAERRELTGRRSARASRRRDHRGARRRWRGRVEQRVEHVALVERGRRRRHERRRCRTRHGRRRGDLHRRRGLRQNLGPRPRPGGR